MPNAIMIDLSQIYVSSLFYKAAGLLKLFSTKLIYLFFKLKIPFTEKTAVGIPLE
jgi:hypothetical protein